MDLNDFFYYSLLQGYKIMGVDKTRIERIAQIKEYKRLYNDFINSLDLDKELKNPIVEYFEMTLRAREFKDMKGKILGKNANLYFGFDKAGYRYVVKRHPLKTSGKYLGDIMNQMLQRSGIK